MPVPFLGPLLGGITTGMGSWITVSQVAGAMVWSAAIVAVSAGAQLLGRRKQSPTYQDDVIHNTATPVVPIPYVFGSVGVGGNVLRATASRGDEREIILGLAEGPCNNIHRIKLNDEDFTNLRSNPIRVFRAGTVDQEAPSDTDFPLIHAEGDVQDFRRLAHLWIRLRHQSLTQSDARISITLEGLHCWNPAFTDRAFSRNPARIALTYLHEVLRIPQDQIDVDSFIALETFCNLYHPETDEISDDLMGAGSIDESAKGWEGPDRPLIVKESAASAARLLVDGNHLRWSAGAGPPQWVRYDFGAEAAQRVAEFELQAYSSSQPTGFEFQASQNEEDWTTLKIRVKDTGSFQTSWGGSFAALETKRFEVDPEDIGRYRWYRVRITSGGTALLRWKMFSHVGAITRRYTFDYALDSFTAKSDFEKLLGRSFFGRIVQSQGKWKAVYLRPPSIIDAEDAPLPPPGEFASNPRYADAIDENASTPIPGESNYYIDPVLTTDGLTFTQAIDQEAEDGYSLAVLFTMPASTTEGDLYDITYYSMPVDTAPDGCPPTNAASSTGPVTLLEAEDNEHAGKTVAFHFKPEMTTGTADFHFVVHVHRDSLSEGFSDTCLDFGTIRLTNEAVIDPGEAGGAVDPQSIAFRFDKASIRRGSIEAGRDEIPNVVRVLYRDRTRNWMQDSAEERDHGDVNRRGEISHEETCDWITDREQARRRAKFLFDKMRYFPGWVRIPSGMAPSALELFDLVTIEHLILPERETLYYIEERDEDKYGRVSFLLREFSPSLFHGDLSSDQDRKGQIAPEGAQPPGEFTLNFVGRREAGVEVDWEAATNAERYIIQKRLISADEQEDSDWLDAGETTGTHFAAKMTDDEIDTYGKDAHIRIAITPQSRSGILGETVFTEAVILPPEGHFTIAYVSTGQDSISLPEYVPGSTRVFVQRQTFYRKTPETESANIWDYEEDATFDGITYRNVPGSVPPNGSRVVIQFIPANVST